MTECPAIEELERFLKEEGPELGVHLETCADCRDAVHRMQRNNDLLAEFADADRAELAAEIGYAGIAAAAGYRILEEIHRGGQGVVYRALQESTHRTVAVKVLLEGALASEEKRRRFEREVEVVASLRHAGIVTVFDSGQLEDGRHFFAMELIEGDTLDVFALLRHTEGWTTEDALRLFSRICGAVHYAHQRGVMHRDLKPSNILVDQDGAPHVLDFGLAKAIGSEPLDAASLTITNEFLGTLAYASPEQLKGDPSLIDIRTDVYSLGVVLYELLTGQSPYPASERMADLVVAISKHDPKPPSSVTGRRSGVMARHPKLTRVGGELDTIVLKALAKDPERRYQSAGELGRDVERYLAGEAIDARRDSTWYVLRKAVARHKLTFSLAAGICAVLVASTIGMSSLWRDSVHAAENARLEARDAEQVVSFLENLFDMSDPDHSRGADLLVRDLLDEGLSRIDELEEQPELQARMLTRMGKCYTNLALYDQGIPLLERAVALRLAHDGEQAYKTSVAQVQLGKAYYYSGSKDAEPLIRAGLATELNLSGLENHAAIDAAVALTAVLNRKGKFDEAMELCERVDEVLRRNPIGGPRSRANLLASWASTKFAKKEFEEALALSRQALEIQREVYSPPHPAMLASLNTQAVCFRNLGLLEDSALAYGELIDQCAQLYGERSDRYGIFQKNRARLLEDLGRLDEAEATYRNALEILTETVSPQHTFALSCRQQLARLLYRGRRYKESLELFTELVDLLPDTPPMRERLCTVLRYVGNCRAALGDQAGAEEALRRSLHEFQVARKPSSAARVMPDLADVLARTRHPDEARELYLGALEALPTDVKYVDDVTHCLSGLGRLHLAAGERAEAERRLREALDCEPGEVQHWSRAAAASALGECLGRGKPAEEFMISGFEGLTESLGSAHPETRVALRRLVEFYEAAEQPSLASDYRSRLTPAENDD